ncbi:MAG: hypothetical protein AABX32_05235 [Nanoarchaeota archaeon]
MAEILNKDIYKFLKLCNEHPTGLELTDVIYYDKKEFEDVLARELSLFCSNKGYVKQIKLRNPFPVIITDKGEAKLKSLGKEFSKKSFLHNKWMYGIIAPLIAAIIFYFLFGSGKADNIISSSKIYLDCISEENTSSIFIKNIGNQQIKNSKILIKSTNMCKFAFSILDSSKWDLENTKWSPIPVIDSDIYKYQADLIQTSFENDMSLEIICPYKSKTYVKVTGDTYEGNQIIC